ncbi:uncharacterized protein PSFLO_01227 [Pseudozyma flocculosa]|nr:uncharacterized protein PSFLO_01227 [Pseudozyma flocculosa]
MTAVPTRILALGLGSLVDSKSAQIQLALLILIVRHLQRLLDDGDDGDDDDDTTPTSAAAARKRIRVSAYDPVFSALDGEILAAFGVEREQEDRGGRYTFRDAVDGRRRHTTTLVYMPHCGRRLYDRILRSNWTPDALRNIVLLCNSLDRYCDTMPARKMRLECQALVRFAEALNDLALQFWNSGVDLPAPLPAIQTGGGGRGASKKNRRRGGGGVGASPDAGAATQSPSVAARSDGDANGDDREATTSQGKRQDDGDDGADFWTLCDEPPVALDAEGVEILH